MPKKTKKEKLIAQYRRKLQQLEGAPIQPTIHATGQPMPTSFSSYVLPKDIPKHEETITTLALPVNEFLGIKKDLIKTLIVICLFFSIELALWKIFG
jgi:hypothetical protein